MNTSLAFQSALSKFVTEAQAVCDLYRTQNFPTLPREVLSVDPGRRYVRIWRNGSQKMSHCFIDSTNGDVLMCATWRAPAKGARGNIYTGTASDSMTAHGAKYLA
jgi:hypothetical protein